MLDQILKVTTQNPWVLALGTIAFFAIKGILWLLIPFMVIRWRKVANRRHRETVNSPSETETAHSDSVFAPETKQAA